MIKDGGSAFPEIETDHDFNHDRNEHVPRTYSYGGMSLRDYFAAKALQALASATNMEGYLVCGSPENAANDAYKFADAMILAREQLPQLHEGKK